MKRLGLLIGTGELPEILIQSAKTRGYEVVVFALPQSEEGLERRVDEFFRLRETDWDEFVGALQREGIREVTAAGKFDKKLIFQALKKNRALFKLLGAVKNRTDTGIIEVLSRDLKKRGIEYLPQSRFLNEYLPPKGILCGTSPNEELRRDLKLAWDNALKISSLGIGQTVLVQQGMVVAVEALEGTDAAIERAGKLTGAGLVMAKVGWRGDKKALEQPAVGLKTLDLLVAADVRALILEAGRVAILDARDFLEQARRHEILVLAEEVEEWPDS